MPAGCRAQGQCPQARGVERSDQLQGLPSQSSLPSLPAAGSLPGALLRRECSLRLPRRLAEGAPTSDGL